MSVLSPTAARPEEADVPRALFDQLHDWVVTVDHKRLGIMYVVVALLFFVIAGVEATMMRLQLAWPGLHIVPPQTFNRLFTMHGTTMVFLMGIPMVFGFGNYLVPLMIGARDLAFPRLNAFGFWILAFGGLLLHFSVIGGDGLYGTGSAPAVGWFAYAPLTGRAFTPGNATDYWNLAIFITGIGTIATAVNLVTTTLTMRGPGMTLGRMPVFVWIMLTISAMTLLILPPLSAAQIMLMLDRFLGAHFFDTQAGGSAVMWQHFFWFFGHPEVYILMLPGFGFVSEIIPVFSRKVLFGYPMIVAASVSIGLVSLSVWAHHMFVVGMGAPLNAFFALSTMLIAVPTGIKIFNWVGTMYGGKLDFRTPMLFCCAFLLQFLCAGLTGLMLSERLGRWHFWLFVIGFNVTFVTMHVQGILGMPRRIYTYQADRGWDIWNLVTTLGVPIQALAVLIFVVNIIVSLRHGTRAGDDPWNAWTLEWATTSPPPPYNFEIVPVTTSRRPLWDLKNPDDPDGPHE